MAVDKPVCLSFSGCGFLGIYHVGVASCIRQYAPHLAQHKVAGASAGALVSCVLMCDCCLGQCTSYTLRLASKARQRALGPLHPDFDLLGILRAGLEEILPPDAHKRCSGKLFISVTRVRDGKNFRISNFPTRDVLIQALICSTFIPLYTGLTPPMIDGVAYVDGAFSDNVPSFPNELTVTVCPFAGESDICPKDVSAGHSLHWSLSVANTPFLLNDVNLLRLSQVLFPPEPVELSEICQQGFRDALSFLSQAGFISRFPDIVQVRACVTTAGQEMKEVEQNLELQPIRSSAYDAFRNRCNSLAGANKSPRHRLRHYSGDVSTRPYKRHVSVTRVPSHVAVRPSNLNTPSNLSTPTNSTHTGELHFLPPRARREFQELMDDSQSLLNSFFQSPVYRLCSVLASPIYLPAELWLRFVSYVSRNVTYRTHTVVDSAVSTAFGVVRGCYNLLDSVSSMLVAYSPLPLPRRRGRERVECSVDVEVNENVVDQGNKKVHFHVRTEADQPDVLQRLRRGRVVDTATASSCLNRLLSNSSVELPSVNETTDGLGAASSTGVIEDFVRAPAVFSYYYPDRDGIHYWEFLDSSAPTTPLKPGGIQRSDSTPLWDSN